MDDIVRGVTVDGRGYHSVGISVSGTLVKGVVTLGVAEFRTGGNVGITEAKTYFSVITMRFVIMTVGCTADHRYY